MSDQLQALRMRIDELDQQIQELISERARCAEQVAAVKQTAGNADFYRPEREAQVLRQVMGRNKGPLRDEAIARVFREIMSACLALERPLTVAFVGPEGAYTQVAVLKHFGHGVNVVPLYAVEEVFQEVEAGNVDYGMVPMEDAPMEGAAKEMTRHTLDMFLQSSLSICGEVQLSIRRKRTGQLTGIRFLVIGARPVLPSGNDKTSLLVSSPNHPISLPQLLEPISRHDLNITYVQLRPVESDIGGSTFFINIEGHKEDQTVAQALADLERKVGPIKILGSYPSGVL